MRILQAVYRCDWCKKTMSASDKHESPFCRRKRCATERYEEAARTAPEVEIVQVGRHNVFVAKEQA